jgi:glycogen debranching enzyme
MKKYTLTIATLLFSFLLLMNSYSLPLFDIAKVELTDTKQQRNFVFTDRVNGYFEGRTFAYTVGEGYKIGNTVIFRDFLSTKDDKPLNRREAKSMKLYPSKFETEFGEAQEKMYLIQNKQYVIISVKSSTESKLGIVPLLNWFKKDIQVTPTEDNKGVIIKNDKILKATSEVPGYVIIYSDKEISLSESTNILKEAKISPNFGNPGHIQSKENQKEINFVIVFSSNLEEALKNAKEVVKDIKKFISLYEKELNDRVLGSYFETPLKEVLDKPMYWVLYSSDGFIEEEFGKGIWAGLPWFKNNWGRDTFISLPGCSLVNGNFKDAKEIILNFANFQNRGTLSIEISSQDEELLKSIYSEIRDINKFIGIRKAGNKLFISVPSYLFSKSFSSKEELILKSETSKSKTLKENLDKVEIKETLTKDRTFGRVPNLVSSLSAVQYNTTDGTPWFIREVMEYINYSGDINFIKEVYPVVKTAIDGAIDNFVDNDGLLTHDDADTWMDARIEGKEAWSPRGNRAVEIQALWITSLEVGIEMAKYMKDNESAKKWEELYKKAKENFVKIFWDDENKRIADRIRKDGFKDFKVRPNMLMSITVPFSSILGEEKEAYILKNAVSELLYPYGIASLSQNDEFFHPWHEKWELYHKDSAYHNGTVWIWNTGFTILSLLKFGYKDLAFQLLTNTLSQVIELGHIGTLSELLDAMPQPDGKPKPSGTYSQAWSTAEISRAWYQGFIGFNPRLSQNKIILSPNLPLAITNLTSSLKFGNNEYLNLQAKVSEKTEEYQISLSNTTRKVILEFTYTSEVDGSRYTLTQTLEPKKTITITINKGNEVTAKLNNKPAKVMKSKGYKNIIGELKFVTPSIPENNQVVKVKDYLKTKIKNGEWF